MRVDDLLDETDLPFAACAFNNPPNETYAVYHEEIKRRGADLMNCITEYGATIEVYSYDFYDDEAVRRVIHALDRHSIEFKKYETTFINSEHLYCTRFEYETILKDSQADRFRAEFNF